MTSRSIIVILTITSILTNSFIVRGQRARTTDRSAVATSQKLNFDTSTTAIVPLDNWYRWEFDSTYKQATLTQIDLLLIDSLQFKSVIDHNKSLNKDNDDFYIDLNKYSYKRQIVAVINKNGQKEVWVNCFCHLSVDSKWKTEVVHVADGGNCYFNFKINLTTKTCYGFAVNGVA